MTRRVFGLCVLLILAAGAQLTEAGVPSPEEARDLLPAVGSASPWPPPDVRITWTSNTLHGQKTTHLKLLAFNDFHGNLQSPSITSARPVGSAAVLAAYLEAAARAAPNRTLILHAGDHVGGSPPVSRLLRNEPAIDFLNLLGNDYCRLGAATHFFDARSWLRDPNRCNVIGTLGNHEFDAGVAELQRLLEGGNAEGGPFIDNPYRGSRVPYVCANVRDRRTGKLILPAYAVAVLDGIPVGVIGAVVRETPQIVPAWAVAGVEFLDESESINRAAAELEGQGIHTLIVTIHQGMVPLAGPEGFRWLGALRAIVAQLDADIDVVISGHTHNYTNALLPNRGGQPVLVTQAYAYGVAYADIDLQIDRRTRDVVRKTAVIVPTWADAGPGLRPDRRVEQLTVAAQRIVAPVVSREVGRTAEAITRSLTPSGESALGDLVADAQRDVTHADIALMNPGGLRSDLPGGTLTWGDILTLHPFGNRLLTTQLSGAQIVRVLEEQWRDAPSARPTILKTSGLYYVWDPSKPSGARVTAICDVHHEPLDPTKLYRVTVNDFLAAGGDGFIALREAPVGELGPLDSEALAQYFAAHAGPIAAHTDGRIARADGDAPNMCAPRRATAVP
jgi:5'-nucleotidase